MTNMTSKLKNPTFLYQIGIIVFIISLFIVLFIPKYCHSEPPSEPGNLNCTSICGSGSEYYIDTNNTISTNTSNIPDKLKYTLKDFYIKSAYNCCATGGYKNCNIKIDMLKYVLRQGVRGLDFAIYSIEGNPVVAASSKLNNEKTTSDYIPFSEVLQVLEQYAFSSGTSPNSKDPLFIHLRIYSTSTTMIKKLGELIKDKTQLFLGNKFSFDNQDDINRNFGNIYLSDLAGKIVLFVQRTQIIQDNTSSILYEYINMISETEMFYSLNYYNVENTRDTTYLINHNKQFMTIAYPDTGDNPPNPNYEICSNYGCQFTCMRHQLDDDSLQLYNKSFNDSGYAFVLKPKNLRWIPPILTKPVPQKLSNSYAPRTVNTEFISFQI